MRDDIGLVQQQLQAHDPLPLLRQVHGPEPCQMLRMRPNHHSIDSGRLLISLSLSIMYFFFCFLFFLEWDMSHEMAISDTNVFSPFISFHQYFNSAVYVVLCVWWCWFHGWEFSFVYFNLIFIFISIWNAWMWIFFCHHFISIWNAEQGKWATKHQPSPYLSLGRGRLHVMPFYGEILC